MHTQDRAIGRLLEVDRELAHVVVPRRRAGSARLLVDNERALESELVEAVALAARRRVRSALLRRLSARVLRQPQPPVESVSALCGQHDLAADLVQMLSHRRLRLLGRLVLAPTVGRRQPSIRETDQLRPRARKARKRRRAGRAVDEAHAIRRVQRRPVDEWLVHTHGTVDDCARPERAGWRCGRRTKRLRTDRREVLHVAAICRGTERPLDRHGCAGVIAQRRRP